MSFFSLLSLLIQESKAAATPFFLGFELVAGGTGEGDLDRGGLVDNRLLGIGDEDRDRDPLPDSESESGGVYEGLPLRPLLGRGDASSESEPLPLAFFLDPQFTGDFDRLLGFQTLPSGDADLEQDLLR